MTKSDIYHLCIKIFGLYYVTQIIKQIVEMIGFLSMMQSQFYDNMPITSVFTSSAFSICIQLVICYVTLLKTDLLVKFVSTKVDSETVALNMNKEDIMSITFAAIGLLGILLAAPALLTQLVNIIYYPPQTEGPIWTTEAKNQFFQNLFYLVASLFIILNGNNISQWLLKRENANQ